MQYKFDFLTKGIHHYIDSVGLLPVTTTLACNSWKVLQNCLFTKLFKTDPDTKTHKILFLQGLLHTLNSKITLYTWSSGYVGVLVEIRVMSLGVQVSFE
jgi:hypothetical protein